MIETIVECANQIKNNKHNKIKPGEKIRLSEAACHGDFIRQGDMYLIVVDSCPKDYVDMDNDSTQLVPGNTEGAKHCLNSLDSVKIKFHKNWSREESYTGEWSEKFECFIGPYFETLEEKEVLHPKHGDVIIPKDMKILVGYQREWDEEEKRERRNRD